MSAEWSNWSGSLKFTPAKVARPRTEEEVAALVAQAGEQNRTIRMVGACHSSSQIIQADDILLSLERMTGLVTTDQVSCEAVVRPGTTLEDASEQLRNAGLALPNLGDVKVQTVAGAIGTGTHGSGKQLPNLAATLIGGRLVTGTGKIVEFSAERDVDLGRAARVSLGALGVLTALRLKLEKVYRLRRREWCARTDDCLAHLDELVDQNRNFDFYWYPRRDEVKLRMLNPPEQALRDWPFARLLDDFEGWSDEVLSKRRELRFEEMEYAVPAQAGPACFREVRQRMLARHRQSVGWRTLYRTTAADDAFLSNASGRATVNISLHQNASLQYWGFFRDLEPIFRDHGGRPHWGKKHTLTGAELRALYPHWEDFLEVRRQMDPAGVFLSPPLGELLGIARDQS